MPETLKDKEGARFLNDGWTNAEDKTEKLGIWDKAGKTFQDNNKHAYPDDAELPQEFLQDLIKVFHFRCRDSWAQEIERRDHGRARDHYDYPYSKRKVGA
jgi:hypothetical protein